MLNLSVSLCLCDGYLTLALLYAEAFEISTFLSADMLQNFFRVNFIAPRQSLREFHFWVI